ncbi:MAG: glycosyltransferase family 2 protein [Chrysiogenia bacterium]
MDISIVTPSLNMLPYLKCCAASIADQQGASVEHIVVDGGSTDGTVSWLAAKPKILSLSEKDKGMYDAVNKGLRLAHVDILACLNCDEQYLPGTLSFVKSFFAAHPSIDILFGDFLVTQPDGSLVAFRKAFAPRRAYIYTSYLYTFTCTMFFRRRIIDEGFWFNSELRIAGDTEWLLRVLKNGYRAKHYPAYFSIFTDSGENASRGKVALAKARGEYCGEMPAWLRRGRYLVNGVRLAEKILHGNYWQISPLKYDIYTVDNPAKRMHFAPLEKTFRWKNS